MIAFQNKQTGGRDRGKRDRGNRRSQGKGDLRGNRFPLLFFDLAPRQGRAGRRERGEIASGGRKKRNERHNATSNNLTRKHTNSTMQIIERKCKAQKVLGQGSNLIIFLGYVDCRKGKNTR